MPTGWSLDKATKRETLRVFVDFVKTQEVLREVDGEIRPVIEEVGRVQEVYVYDPNEYTDENQFLAEAKKLARQKLRSLRAEDEEDEGEPISIS